MNGAKVGDSRRNGWERRIRGCFRCTEELVGTDRSNQQILAMSKRCTIVVGFTATVVVGIWAQEDHMTPRTTRCPGQRMGDDTTRNHALNGEPSNPAQEYIALRQFVFTCELGDGFSRGCQA